MTTLTGLVAAGAGLGLVTEGLATIIRPGITFRPVEPEPPRLPMAAAWREPVLSPTGRRFLDIVAELTAR
jgi:DNA-binding transcriptional LysR family regulator